MSNKFNIVLKGKFLSPLVLVLLLASCIPNQKVLYLQKGNNLVQVDSLISPSYPDYRLQIGDILNVDVKSNNPEIAIIFQKQSMSNAQGQLANNAADVNYLDGYPIDVNGKVDLPLIGKVYVLGETISTVKDKIEVKIKAYIPDAYVQVRLGGLRYTALGEFKRPGRYSILQSQVTIFEAIANAGDLTVLANREKALVIRQYAKGTKIHEVDLTSRNIFNSDFYYLKPNDQLYLEPLPVRQLGAGVGVTGFQTFTSVLSAVSSALLIIVSLNRL
jgi:polysaccharide export outer membrane protein